MLNALPRPFEGDVDVAASFVAAGEIADRVADPVGAPRPWLCAYLAQQVPVDKERRTALRRTSGSDTVPARLLADGMFTIGEDAIRA